MKIRVLLLLLIIGCSSATAQITSTGQLLDAMQVKYRGKWFKEYTFAQQTIRYNQKGAIRDTAIWNEAVSYPDHFRIDFNQEGQFVIFKNDSSWRFQNYKLQGSRFEPQEFLLFKGGMYFISPATIMNKLIAYGYDTSIFREDRLNGRKAYVIGAKKGDLKTKQFWIDADHFYTVRRISPLRDGSALDVQYGDHKAVKGGWVEQVVTFYRDGRLIQIENYLDINTSGKLDPQIFNVEKPAVTWFEKRK